MAESRISSAGKGTRRRRKRGSLSTRTAVIAGISSSVPSRVLTNKELEKVVDTTDEWITTRTGIDERRIAAPEEPLSKFAVEASGRAGAGVEARDLDLIICATVTPDAHPGDSLLHPEGSGRRARPPSTCRPDARDSSTPCSGEAVHRERRYRHVLVIGAELLSSSRTTDRATCVIFADGAGRRS